MRYDDLVKIDDLINCEGSILSLFVSVINDRSELYLSSRTVSEEYIFAQIELKTLHKYLTSQIHLNEVIHSNNNVKYLLVRKSFGKVLIPIEDFSKVQLVFGDILYKDLNQDLRF